MRRGVLQRGVRELYKLKIKLKLKINKKIILFKII